MKRPFKRQCSDTIRFSASVRDRVLNLFAKHGQMTDEEILREYMLLYGPVPGSSVRTRRRELEHDGLIKETGELGIVVATGRRCLIWEPVNRRVGTAAGACVFD